MFGGSVPSVVAVDGYCVGNSIPTGTQHVCGNSIVTGDIGRCVCSGSF